MEQGKGQGDPLPEAAAEQLPADAQEEPGPGAYPEGAERRAGEQDRAGHRRPLLHGAADVRRCDRHRDLRSVRVWE